MNLLKKIKQMFKKDRHEAYTFSSYYFEFKMKDADYVFRFAIPKGWANDTARMRQEYCALLTPEGKNFNLTPAFISIRMNDMQERSGGLAIYRKKLVEAFTRDGSVIDEILSQPKTFDNREVVVMMLREEKIDYTRFQLILALQEDLTTHINFAFQVNTSDLQVVSKYIPLFYSIIQTIWIAEKEIAQQQLKDYFKRILSNVDIVDGITSVVE